MSYIQFLESINYDKVSTLPSSKLDISIFEKSLRTLSEGEWVRRGERKALKLFHHASLRVPAYKHFLKTNGVKSDKIKTIADFRNLPITDKHNYINKYSIKDRSWDAKTIQNKLIAVSSGTTGSPQLWPRGTYQELEAVILHELIYRYLFGMDTRSTLAVICFPMGIYVSGIATTIPTFTISEKGYPLTIITSGNSKSEVLKAIQTLHMEYDQILLIGHPFFIKDVIESGVKEGVPWKKLNVRAMVCSEGFNEEWRNYLLKMLGKNLSSFDLINTYGSSEMLLMGFETPITISIRRAAEKNKTLCQNIFKLDTPPNLFQYNPLMRYVESVGDELIFTSQSGIPLIRFNLHDRGQILSSDIIKHFPDIKLKQWNLPLISLIDRSDNTIVFYAANIYPENIRNILNHKQFLGFLTGKFTMRKINAPKMEQILEINIELRDATKTNNKLIRNVKERIVKMLPKINAEYAYILEHYKKGKKHLVPKIKLWPYQSEPYFKPGLKPRYIFKSG
ncbi:MAG: hypothetical protein AAB407_04165 [Patescibacteria group bacterium]